MPGYSGTPLVQKIGIQAGFKVFAINPPSDYQKLLAPMPPDVEFVSKASATTNVVHLFTAQRKELAKVLMSLRKSLAPDAIVWVSWPKKSSKVETDITEDVIRNVALPMGWVDIKVCAVTDVWSGLKLVVRKELR